jgi:hypothetical protein
MVSLLVFRDNTCNYVCEEWVNADSIRDRPCCTDRPFGDEELRVEEELSAAAIAQPPAIGDCNHHQDLVWSRCIGH